jgi:hypothetical protein
MPPSAWVDDRSGSRGGSAGEVALRFRAKLFGRPLPRRKLKLEHIDGVARPRSATNTRPVRHTSRRTCASFCSDRCVLTFVVVCLARLSLAGSGCATTWPLHSCW